jgi:hypothetical protein
VVLATVLGKVMAVVKGGPQKMQEMAMEQMMKQMMKQMGAASGGHTPLVGLLCVWLFVFLFVVCFLFLFFFLRGGVARAHSLWACHRAGFVGCGRWQRACGPRDVEALQARVLAPGTLPRPPAALQQGACCAQLA